MNCNLDGTELTTEQLAQIALDHGLMTPEAWVTIRASIHNANLRNGRMHEMTRDVRLAMFGRGELRLDTRPRGERRTH